MKIHRLKIAAAVAAMTGVAVAATPTVNPPAQAAQQKPSPIAAAPKLKISKPVPVVEIPEEPGGSRTVHYHRGDTVSVRTQKRFATAVQIRNEQIMKIVGGDNDDWSADLDDAHTVIVLRPQTSAPRNSRTSLVVTTTSGNVYLIEVALSDFTHDELITIVPADKDMKAAADAPPKFVDAAVVEGLKTELYNSHQEITEIQAEADKRVAEANKRVVEADKRATDAIEQFRADYPGEMSFGYRWKKNVGPFYVSAVWTDHRFTYIKADPDEVGSLYAIRDKKPMLVDAPFARGMYTVPMVLNGDFYLEAGNQKLMIYRTDRGK